MPIGFWVGVAFLLGLCIGSFLNVVIYRLPIANKDLNLNKPVWSFCPNCKRRLTIADLIPLFSFLMLGQRCRGCKQRISWRYFGVELLTGVLFALLAWHSRSDPATAIALIAFTAILIPIFFIDLERFMIPISLTLLTTLIPVVRDIWGIVQHEPNHELIWGWLPRSVLGAVVGVLIFGAVRVAGWLWKGVEAMGLGDVLLARGVGAMLIALVPIGAHPLRLLPIWVLLSCLSGIVIGYPLILWRNRQEENPKNLQESKPEEVNSAPNEEENFEREGTFGQQVTDIAWYLWLGDLIEYLVFTFGQRKEALTTPPPVEDDWEPAPSEIPFGPFLVAGFLAAVFIGEWITAAYLNYAMPPMTPLP